jgi:pyrroloquinoline quinone biosynthesis protein D
MRAEMTLMDEQSRPILARGVRLRDHPITGEPILLFPEGVLPLDDVTHDILLCCTGEMSLEDIIKSLSRENEADYDMVHRDVCECLLHLRQQMLIVLAK